MGFNNAHQKIAAGWHMTLKEIKANGHDLLSAGETKRDRGLEQPSVRINYRGFDGKPIKEPSGKPRARWRYSDPEAAAAAGRGKYDSRKEGGVDLYVSHAGNHDWEAIIKDPSTPIYIVEGEAKADTLAKYGLAAVAISGAQSGMSGGDLVSLLKQVNWKGRKFYLIPDSDHKKPGTGGADIRRGFGTLGIKVETIGGTGAVFQLPTLNINPDDIWKSKTGADDFIALRGFKAFKELRKSAVPVSSSEIQGWVTNGAIPEVLRNLKPVDRDWFNKWPPPAEYIVAPYLQKGESAVVASIGGTGKSFFLFRMCIAICTGVDFFGFPVLGKRRAMYVMAERSKESFQRRFHKVAHAMADELDPGPRADFKRDLFSNYYASPLAGEELKLIEYKSSQWVPSALVDALIRELKAAGIEVLFLDPMSRFHGAPENDAAAMSAFTKALERIMQATGCSIVLVHHTGKDETRDSQYLARGSSAIIDNTSEAITLKAIKPDDTQGRARLDLSHLNTDDGESKCDIVHVRHQRCSDGRPAPDLFLLRSKNGVLVDRHIKPKTVGAIAEDPVLVDKIMRWTEAQPEHGFTKNQFVSRYEDTWGLSRPHAGALFDEYVEADTFKATGKKYRNGPLYRAEFTSLQGGDLQTCKQPKKWPVNKKVEGA